METPMPFLPWLRRKTGRPAAILAARIEAAPSSEPSSPDPTQGNPMSSEGLHVSRDRLSRDTLHKHYAIVSLMEELEAVDWYRQRADDCEDAELKRILLHNAREEIEHACMLLEWLRQNDAEFADQMRKYLFKDGSVTAREEAVMGREAEPS
jgi:hypothetical protein